MDMKALSGVRPVLWMAVAAAAMYLLWWAAFDRSGKRSDVRSEEHLKQVAAELNRGLPSMLDAETELTSTGAAPAVLIYNYRLVNFIAERIDRDRFAAAAKQQVVQGACGRRETRGDFLERGVTLRYAYFDRDKKPIATVDVTPADCGIEVGQ
jgi:hypothetical protein